MELSILHGRLLHGLLSGARQSESWQHSDLLTRTRVFSPGNMLGARKGASGPRKGRKSTWLQQFGSTNLHIEKPTLTDQLNLPHHARIEALPFSAPWNFSMIAK